MSRAMQLVLRIPMSCTASFPPTPPFPPVPHTPSPLPCTEQHPRLCWPCCGDAGSNIQQAVVVTRLHCPFAHTSPHTQSNTHVVLATLKRSESELSSFQRKVFKVDDHMGIAICGIAADGRVLCKYMRNECLNHRCGKVWGELGGLLVKGSRSFLASVHPTCHTSTMYSNMGYPHTLLTCLLSHLATDAASINLLSAPCPAQSHFFSHV